MRWMLEREEVEDRSRSLDDDRADDDGGGGAVGGILADEPGLGKSLTTIALMLSGRPSNPRRLPSLIVSPTPVIAAQWQGEIDRFTVPEAAAEAAAEAVAAAEGAVEEGKKAGAVGGASKRAKRAKRTKKVGDDEGASAAATGGASAGANDATGGGLSRAVRVIHYTGPPSPYSEAKALDLVADLRSAELVLTDLATIRKEYHYLQVGR